MPESFKVLVKEMKSLCLNVELEGHGTKAVDIETELEDDEDSSLYQAIADDARKTEDDDASALDDIAAGLEELIGGATDDEQINTLIGEEGDR